VFAIWNGGLELIGGVAMAIAVILLYIRYHQLPMRHYLDVLAIGLMAALVFGRIGCFMNGCCYGKPTELPWGVRFPYASFVYHSQVRPDLDRHRPEPRLKLPDEYFGYQDGQGGYDPGLKPWKYLTPRQQELVTTGQYRALPVHPTQLYSSLGAGLLGLIFYGIWRRAQRAEEAGTYPFLTKPGSTFSVMFVLYGVGRFLMEWIRDDNPFEIDSLTISQLLSIALIILGIILIIYVTVSKPEKLPASAPK
jgi:phosphatidylglycerol:prolipoprotein diacylglycerol transferase